MATTSSILARPRETRSLGPLLLLLIVGSLLAVSVLLSKVAAGFSAPMLTYLTLAMACSGSVLLLLNGGVRGRGSRLRELIPYGLVAGALLALGSGLGYLTVHLVGAAFIALTLSFPPMLTWLLSLALRLERFDALRICGLAIGLIGGVLLAIGKGVNAPTDSGAVLAACAIPVVLAIGNVFRTRFWPKGASPRELADITLLCGAAITLPFALALEGPAAMALVLRSPMTLVLLSATVTFVAQYVAMFRLQQVAGPVYMSQIGSVAAIVGGPVAVLALGEKLPGGFALAVALILTGLAVFQARALIDLRPPGVRHFEPPSSR
ncbi:MAG: hypothetical protein KF813_06015 [Trueperaceae bacterium]|nr:hypothetical protein [Trueperaceae bacterium]